jgi:RNA-directed DNA polymerase
MMEAVVERGNMVRAYRRVLKNNGAPGVDGMPVTELRDYLAGGAWERMKKELLEGRYRPSAVRPVEIPKPDGGKRHLGIPTVVDRLVGQAIHQVLEPVFDPEFSESSYGFRRGRSAHDAVVKAQGYVTEGYRWVVDIDLAKFFDTVNHDVLMTAVANRVKDSRMLRTLYAFLNTGILADGIVSARSEGTPQGSPLSPLLSNILLDRLDKELESRGHRFCRYADDCNIYVRTERSGQRVRESVEQFLSKRLRLRVNGEKSAVARPWKRDYLGYTMTSERKPRLRVAEKSVKRLKDNLRGVLRRGRGRNVGRTTEDLNLILRGWGGYFRLNGVKTVVEEVDGWMRRKMRCILWRQWKRGRTRAAKLMKRGLGEERARKSSMNGRGPWWNAGARHMNEAFDLKYFRMLGLIELRDIAYAGR